MTRKTTREDLVKLLESAKPSVKKDFLYYDRTLLDLDLPKFRKESSEKEFKRLSTLLADIEAIVL